MRQTNLPTRGEYLIRPGGTSSMRTVGAVLELKTPYLAIVSTRDAAGARGRDRGG
jgi:hypothetical protein